MPEATLDLADLSLWADGFPDDVFAGLAPAHTRVPPDTHRDRR